MLILAVWGKSDTFKSLDDCLIAYPAVKVIPDLAGY